MAEAPVPWQGPTLVCPVCRFEGTAWPLDSLLRCSNPACPEAYSWLTPGIPVIGPASVRERIARMDTPGPLPAQGALGSWLDAVAPDSEAFASFSRAAIFLQTMQPATDDPFYAALCDALLPELQVGSTVADLGCGTGNLALEIARRAAVSIVGLDMDAHLLRWAERAAAGVEFEAPVRIDAGRFAVGKVSVGPVCSGAAVSFLAGNVLDPPFEPASFDLVTLVNVLDAMPYPAVALRQAAATLRPGGYLLFSSPDSWNSATTPAKRWPATTAAGWDRVFARHGLETLARIDDLEWRLRDSPRLHHLYRVHGRLLRKPYPA